jgi:glycosyltransferase involved in cell wall biosynthesis
MHVHVPTPGDHYSPATGSATMTVIHELARRHAARGGRTQVIVGRGTRHDYPVGDGVEVGFPPLPTRSRKGTDVALGRIGLSRPFASGLYRPALAAVDPDFDGVVFLHNSPPAVALFGEQRRRAQTCLYVHNELFRTYGRREMRKTLAGADRVICVSAFMADRLTERLGQANANVRVVHNGVDTERFRPGESGSPPPDEPVVLFVGRVVPYKGVDVLLRAAVKIAGHGRRFRVRVVGSSDFSAASALSPYEVELRRIARPLGDRVEFQPFVDRDRVVDEYRAASIFCIPSTWDEPCSLTLPEALASGLASIASCRGGIPEVGGDAVLYFRPPDVDELAERLCHLIDDASARAEWGRRARRRAQALSWETQYGRLLAALDDA